LDRHHQPSAALEIAGLPKRPTSFVYTWAAAERDGAGIHA
jgi:hypothetical protein